MATTAVGDENPTLSDVIKRLSPGGVYQPLVEALTVQTPELEDATWKEGNLPNGELITTRSGLPSIGWRAYNEGVTAGKSRTDQLTETCGMLEGISNVDAKLANFNGNAAAFRASEDKGFLIAMKKEVGSGIFYHSTATSPRKFNGLSPRLDSLTGPYNDQIVDSDITSTDADQTSVWLIVWHPELVYLMYPKGSVAGFKHDDMGPRMVSDAAGKEYKAFTSVFNWDVGLVVKDARYVARLCNIDTSAIAKTGKLLIEGMIDLTERIENLDYPGARPVLYMNRTISTYLRQQATDVVKSTVMDFDTIGGKRIMTFNGIPIRRTDSIVNTEAIVS